MNTIEKLIESEKNAEELFKTIEERGMIIPGKTEHELNSEIFLLAKELFGIDKYWHKRIVRAGKNTLQPYRENPPDHTLQSDEILFLDFGPIFEDWEADFGRTFVIGTDPVKIKLRDDIEKAWIETRNWFIQQEQVTGAELFQYSVQISKKFGWEFGAEIAGHLIGKFPHEMGLSDGKFELYIHPENQIDMKAPDQNGNQRFWILELFFVDREKEIGGFFEQLLH